MERTRGWTARRTAGLAPRLAAVVAVLTLVGCGPPARFEGPIALRASGDDVQMVICQHNVVDAWVVSTRQSGGQGEWLTIWSAAGSHEFEAGEVVTLGRAPDGMLTFERAATDDIREGTVVKVNVSLTNAVKSQIIAFFEPLPAGGLPSDAWLHPDGTTSVEPCAQEER